MIYKQKLITLMTIFSLMSVGWGCVDGIEVELWGECYNIEEKRIWIYLGVDSQVKFLLKLVNW